MFTESGPGLLYVNSKIGDPALSDKVFNKWYDDVHVPDVFVAKGIQSANRYITTEFPVERPYLALYPLQDVQHLDSKEFHAIPHTSELLPDSGTIFDLVNFDIRYYTHLKTTSQGQPGEKSQFTL
jgi:hypothetical protein